MKLQQAILIKQAQPKIIKQAQERKEPTKDKTVLNMKELELDRLTIRRRTAQRLLTKEIRFMKAARCIFERASIAYGKALTGYNKLDLAYAEQTKLTLCKAKKSRKTRQTKAKSFNPIPAKLRSLLKNLPEEAVARIIEEYDRQ